MLGVNLAGGEFGTVGGGPYGTNYIYPNTAEIDYYAGKGMDVIRLPIKWERIQPQQNGALDPQELSRIEALVDYAASKGVTVVFDIHNYGKAYGDQLIGSAGLPNASFADLWERLAEEFKAAPNVMFGLMNEPYLQTAAQWLASVNTAIEAIRTTGAQQLILVPGTYWGGAHSWVSSDNDTVIGAGVVDPLNNYTFEVHQYLDHDSSGTSTNVVSATIGVERLQAVTDWARATGNTLFLGEFGAGSDAASLQALDNMVRFMDDNADVWVGATYWAGGPWWGNYAFSIEPADLANPVDRPQMDVLEKYDLAWSPVGSSDPVIVSDGGGASASLSVAENTTGVTTVHAVDGNGGPTTYKIVGGADAADFTINALTGSLSFRSAPDYEQPRDADRNNVYQVVVRAENGARHDEQALAVAVTNVNESAANPGQGTAAQPAGPAASGAGSGSGSLPSGGGSTQQIAVPRTPAFAEPARSTGVASGGESGFRDGRGRMVQIGSDGDDRIEGVAGGNHLYGGKGNDTLVGSQSADQLEGQAGNDLLDGGGGDDRLEGGDNDDHLRGGEGNDSLLGGNGDDWLEGEAGDDQLEGEDGNDRLDGGNGNDRLFGGSGRDQLRGGAGNDQLEGQSGNDDLLGGDGDDALFGESGDDRLEGGNNNDRLQGGDGADKLLGGSGDDFLLGESGADWLEGEDGNDRLEGGDGADTLQGGSGDDRLQGGSGDDRLDGQSGDDRLEGEDGQDRLDGGDGNDVLQGGNGDDWLSGGAGDDLLEGQAGNDTFVFGPGSGRDTIIGFASGQGSEDVVELSGVSDFADLLARASQVGGSTVITLGGAELTLKDVSLSSLNADDFRFL